MVDSSPGECATQVDGHRVLSRITQFFEVEDDAGNKVRSAKFAVDVARSFGGVSSKQAEAEFLATFDEYMKRVGEVLNGSEAFENTVEDVAGPVAENESEYDVDDQYQSEVRKPCIFDRDLVRIKIVEPGSQTPMGCAQLIVSQTTKQVLNSMDQVTMLYLKALVGNRRTVFSYHNLYDHGHRDILSCNADLEHAVHTTELREKGRLVLYIEAWMEAWPSRKSSRCNTAR